VPLRHPGVSFTAHPERLPYPVMVPTHATHRDTASRRGRTLRRLLTLGLVVAVGGCSLVRQVTGSAPEPAGTATPNGEPGDRGFYDYE